MPLPEPQEDESHEDFIARCMADPVMVEDFDDPGQRQAVCEGQWKTEASRTMAEIEIRTVPLRELRFEDLDGQAHIEGRAIVYNEPSCDFGGWVERFAPGSAKLDEDLLILFDHDSSMVLGRTSSGTAQAEADELGVTFRADPPTTSWYQDLRVSMQRGDIRHCSFAFIPIEDSIAYDVDLGTIVRTVTQAEILELSVVAMPAYPQTSSTARERVAEIRSQLTNSTDQAGDPVLDEDAGDPATTDREVVLIPGIGLRTFKKKEA